MKERRLKDRNLSKINAIRFVVAIFVSAALLMLNGCFLGIFSNSNASIYRKIEAIKSETESKYIFVGTDGITIDRTFHSYQSAAESLLSIKPYSNDSEKYAFQLYRDDSDKYFGEDEAYFSGFMYERYIDDLHTQKSEMKVILCAMNYQTGRATIRKEIDVLSTYRPKIIEYTIEDRVFIRHNNNFEIFDMKSGCTLYSEPSDLDSAFITHYTKKSFGKNYAVKTYHCDTLRFYEYNGEQYKLYTITDERLKAVNNNVAYFFMVGDVLYFANHHSDIGGNSDALEILFGVDYKTNTRFTAEEVEEMILAAEENRPVVSDPEINVNGEVYKYSLGNNSKNKFASQEIEITRKSDGVQRIINCEYLYNKNAVYKKSTDLWSRNGKNHNYYHEPNALFVVEDKIIIVCTTSKRSSWGWYPAVYFLEYDFNTETVLYAGLTKNGASRILKAS